MIMMITRVVIYLLGCLRSLTRRRLRRVLRRRDSKRKPAQPKESDDRTIQNVKIKEGATEEESAVGPVVNEGSG